MQGSVRSLRHRRVTISTCMVPLMCIAFLFANNHDSPQFRLPVGVTAHWPCCGMHLLATCLRLLPRAKGQPLLCRLGWRHGSSGPVPLAYFKVTSDSVDYNKTPLLIFHGLFGLKANWRSISNQLANTTQRAVYSIDLRNHGDSPHVDGELSDIATMASDIDLFLERTYLSQAILLGHR